MSALLDDMLGIISSLLKGLGAVASAYVSEKTRAFHVWMISAFDQVVLLLVPTFGNSSTGYLYLFTGTNKPGIWAIQTRRSAKMTQRCSI